jgi:hypothetical protein
MNLISETGETLHLSRVSCEYRALHVSDPYILKTISFGIDIKIMSLLV